MRARHSAALLLEDAYQYLQWYLASHNHANANLLHKNLSGLSLNSSHLQGQSHKAAQGQGHAPPKRAPLQAAKREEGEGEEEEEEGEEGGPQEDAGGVLLTVQVDGIDGDQLVQFRSLQVSQS